jgi:hypothetical protein
MSPVLNPKRNLPQVKPNELATNVDPGLRRAGAVKPCGRNSALRRNDEKGQERSWDTLSVRGKQIMTLKAGPAAKPPRMTMALRLIGLARHRVASAPLNDWISGTYIHRPKRCSGTKSRLGPSKKLLRIAREGNEPIPVRHFHLGQRLRVEHVVNPDDPVEIKDVGGHRVDLVAR